MGERTIERERGRERKREKKRERIKQGLKQIRASILEAENESGPKSFFS